MQDLRNIILYIMQCVFKYVIVLPLVFFLNNSSIFVFVVSFTQECSNLLRFTYDAGILVHLQHGYLSFVINTKGYYYRRLLFYSDCLSK